MLLKIRLEMLIPLEDVGAAIKEATAWRGKLDVACKTPAKTVRIVFPPLFYCACDD